MSEYINYSELGLFEDVRVVAPILYDGGWTSKDRNELFKNYFGDVMREDFDFTEWKFAHPDVMVDSADELLLEIDDQIDEICEIIAGLEEA